MTNLHQASLPTVRAEFYSIMQKENETVLNYSSRVDIIVSTMAKLGEKVSTGAWIYALGNDLRAEFKESKDGILYNKDGFNTVMFVKTKLLSEEAVLTSKSKKEATVLTSKRQEQDDEIALSSLTIKQKKKDPPPNTFDDSKEKALYFKGKGGKGKGKDIPKSNDLWRANDFDGTQPWTNWVDSPAAIAEPHHGQWAPSPKGKGRGKGTTKGFDPQTLWCDIHQKSGHSTDWCFENPNRSGGPPPHSDGLWCETYNRPGHKASSCFATTIRIPPKGKGKLRES